MIRAKQVADLITFCRLLLSPVLAALGVLVGGRALPVVAVLMVLNWTGDALDGPIARRNVPNYHTWLGDADIQVDSLVSAGLLLYLAGAGFVEPWAAGLYLGLWLLVLLWLRMPRALMMLFQAPIYGYFIWTTWVNARLAGWLLIGWIVVAIVITWPRFPREVVPGFLRGMGRIGRG
jgi:phosphatidylglycerophosphate synthase